MFTTKQQVDRHVQTILRQRSSDVERKKQGYIIAAQYVKVKDYTTALRYLDGFLSVTPDFPKAFTLRGQINEALKEPQKALESYKTSLKLDENQKDVLVKVCMLYCDVDVDVSSAEYWADRLEMMCPAHEVLFRLREKICASQGTGENTKELECLYGIELSKRPNDIKTHIKLLNLYLEQGRVNEAYTKAVKDESSGLLKGNLDWYKCLIDVYKKYQTESGQRVNGDFHIQLLWAQCQLVLLSLEQARVGDCLEALKNFDQAVLSTSCLSSESDQWRVFQQEMIAQVYFLSGVLLLKKAKDGCQSNEEATKLCAPCFLFSYAVLQPNIKAAWYVQSTDEMRSWYRRWYELGCLRACQSGHMMRRLSSFRLQDWVNQVQEELCNVQGKKQIFEVLFNSARIEVDRSKSYLFNNTQLTTFSPRLPTDEDLQCLDQATENLWPDSLHHVIWRALQYYSIREEVQPDYNIHLFDNIQYGNLRLGTASPDTLCQLDVQAFVYATVFDVTNHLQIALPEYGVPQMLPVFIHDKLGSCTQSEWWSATYQLVHGTNKERQGELRRILQTGLEKIRLVGKHGLDAPTLVHLARTFTERAKENKAVPHDGTLVSMIDNQNAIQARIEHYWKGAIKVLEDLQCNKNMTPPKYQLFSNRDVQLGEEEVNTLLKEARYELALFLMESEQYEDAITLLSKVHSPEAAFEEGMCYKQLAAIAADKSYDNISNQDCPTEKALLEKVLHSLKRVLDQVGTDHKHPLYTRAGDEYEEVSVWLERLDLKEEPSETSFVLDPTSSPSVVNRTSRFGVISNLTPDSPQVVNRSLLFSTPKHDSTSRYSKRTPVRRPQPSPDRLDIQLQMLSRSNKEMLQEFRRSRKTLQHLQNQVEVLENSNRKLDDTVYTVKKEIDEIQTTLQKNMLQMQALGDTQRKRDEELDVLRRSQTENTQHLKELKEDHMHQFRLLQDKINELFDGMKSLQELQKASASLQQAQVQAQAQASSMMLPPGGLPAFYGANLRAQRGMMAQQYPGGYGQGYPPEYDYYAHRFMTPMMPQQYVAAGHDVHEQSHRETMTGVLPHVDQEYEDETYVDESVEPSIPTVGAVSSQPNAAPSYQIYSQSVGHHIPGPGFFSTADMVNSKAVAMQSVPEPVSQECSRPAVTTSTPAVSAASVSGPSLFMMPKGQISTSFPLPMPAAAKPPDINALTSTATQPPTVVKSPDKYTDECDKETDGEATTPETSFNDYKPLVSLPEVITKSGEEEETVMFSERAKLYRFIEKQWKERGIGTIKILHNEQEGTVRILMRRDQVLKVCANHRIKADIDVEYKDSNDKKTLTWRATDYTDEEPRLEQFCCRFKTPEIAANFKEMFEKAKEIAKKNMTPKKQDASKMENISKAPQSLSATSQSPQSVFASSTSIGKSVFSFGSTTFGTKSTVSATDMLRSLAQNSKDNKVDEEQKVFGGFTFTAPPLVTDTVSDKTRASTDDVKPDDSGNKPKPFAGFIFGSSPPKPGFGKTLDFNQPTSSSSTALKSAAESTKTTASQSAGLNKDHETQQIEDHLEPNNDRSPENTVATTVGEERDEKLFGDQAKLYVNDTVANKWKEIGGGVLEILKNSNKGTYRILMQKGQMLKVSITKNMKLLPVEGNKKSWCWCAEDEVSGIQQFAVRFRDEQLASHFKKVFDECVSAIAASSGDGKVAEQTASLAEKFKMTPGEWICDSCYVVNKPDSKRCVACKSLKPGEKDEEETTKPTSSITLGKSGGFQFSGKTDQSFSFGTSFQPATTATSAGIFSFKSTSPFDLTKFGNVSSQSETKVGKEPVIKITEVGSEKPDTSKEGFGNQFQAKLGEWVCEGCYVRNKASDKKCVACETAKPGESEKELPATTSASFSITSSSFKFGSGGGFNFTSSNTTFPGSQFAFGQATKCEDKNKTVDDVSSREDNVRGKFNTQQKTPKTPTTPLSPKDDGYYVNQEGEDDHIYFTPVVKLPENIEIKTGEEEEELLYYQRAKLFRFIDSEWKERGIGEVRILRHKKTGKTRILMRRDQILKICMNHALTKELELKPMLNSKGKAWVWYAEDFAEDKLTHEQFAIKFASEDIANSFKEIFDAARDHPKSLPVVEHVPDVKHGKPDLKSSAVKSEQTASPKSTAGMSFTSAPLDSKTDVSQVFGVKSSASPVFGQLKPEIFGSSKVFGAFGTSEKMAFGKEDKVGREASESGLLAKLLAEPAKDVPSLSVDNSSSSSSSSDDVIIIKEEEIPAEKLEAARKWQLPDRFYLYEDRRPCKGCLGCLTDEFDFSTIGSAKTVKIPQKTVKPAEKRAEIKDKTSPVIKTEADSTSNIEIVEFGKASTFGDFAALAAKAGNTFAFGKGSDSKSPGWSGAGSTLFSSTQQKKHVKNEEGEEDNEDVEEGPDIHFEPIVQLPEVVDLKTGEEEEEKLFCQRAKLYRFDNGQWKERGVGEMKILRHKSTGRFRLLMRREQVLKVACNHYLTEDMVLKPLQTSENAWCWYAVDHTENEPKNEQFAIRFKTKELAEMFREKFTECQEKLRTGENTNSEVESSQPDEHTTSDSQQDDDDDSDDYESNEDEQLFCKRATMFYLEDDSNPKQVGLGELVIVNDEDVGGARVRMKSDQNKLICNHIICKTYKLKCDVKKKYCEWTALDFSTDEPKRHHFKVQFSSTNATEEFKQAFDKGLEAAMASCIDEIREGMSLTGELTKPQIAGYEET